MPAHLVWNAVSLACGRIPLRAGSGGPGNVSGGAAGAAGTVASLGLAAVVRRVDTGTLGERGRLVLGDKAGSDTCWGTDRERRRLESRFWGKRRDVAYRTSYREAHRLYIWSVCVPRTTGTHDCCSGLTPLPVHTAT